MNLKNGIGNQMMKAMNSLEISPHQSENFPHFRGAANHQMTRNDGEQSTAHSMFDISKNGKFGSVGERQ